MWETTSNQIPGAPQFSSRGGGTSAGARSCRARSWGSRWRGAWIPASASGSCAGEQSTSFSTLLKPIVQSSQEALRMANRKHLGNGHYFVLGDHLLVGLARVRAVHPAPPHAALNHLKNQKTAQYQHKKCSDCYYCSFKAFSESSFFFEWAFSELGSTS